MDKIDHSTEALLNGNLNNLWRIWSPFDCADIADDFGIKIDGKPIIVKCANPMLLACLYIADGYIKSNCH